VKFRICTGRLGLVALAVVACAVVGCRERIGGVATVTASPSTTAAVSSTPDPESPSAPTSEPPSTAVTAAIGMGKLVELELELPAPAFRGTPKPQKEPNVEPALGKPRPAFMVPDGTINLAVDQPVTASDPAPSAGEVDFVTNGDKEASDFGYLELRPGSEWVQIDLGQKSTIFAILIWHNHADARVYRDVIVQVGDDPDFLDAATVYNNDYDNTSGMGIGQDMGYVETSEGRLIDAKGVEGRYIRLYSNGNHFDPKNHYTEVEVFGKPAT